jgi:predicted nucleotide-binding protein
MRVFIGSSGKGLEDLEIVRRLIKDANMDPLPWSIPGTFPLGVSTWQGLTDLAKQVDAGAFVFREDDEGLINKMPQAVTRDNVILELGLFTGYHGVSKCAIFRRGNPWLPTDLSGITHVSLDALDEAQLAVNAWAREMRKTVQLPYAFTIEQIGAIATAMKNSGVSQYQVYGLMKLLGVGPSATDDGIERFLHNA